MNKLFSALAIMLMIGSTAFAFAPKDIEKVQTRFCNEDPPTKKLILSDIEQETAYEICLSLENTGEEDLPVITNFVDAVKTADGLHTACRNEEDEAERFAPFVELDGDANVALLAGETIEMKATLLFPKGYAGERSGCFTTRIGGQELQEGAVNLILRKANILEISVAGTDKHPPKKDKKEKREERREEREEKREERKEKRQERNEDKARAKLEKVFEKQGLTLEEIAEGDLTDEEMKEVRQTLKDQKKKSWWKRVFSSISSFFNWLSE